MVDFEFVYALEEKFVVEFEFVNDVVFAVNKPFVNVKLPFVDV